MPVSADRFTQEYWAAPSPTDANTIAFTARGVTASTWWRHGHSHLDESQIWLEHFGGEAPQYEQVTKDEARSGWPMWSGDGKTLYYVSDKNGPENIWTKAAGGGDARAVTSFKTGRVLWPTMSYDGKAMVFERDFGVWSLDVASGKASEVADHPPRRKSGARRGAPVADDGLPVVGAVTRWKKDRLHVARRRLRGVARDGGEATRVTTTPEVEAELTWAPDSRRLAYTSSRDGANHIFIYDFGARTETRLTDGPANDVAPRWSPDGKSIAFMRGAKELRVVDAATKQDRVLATGQLDRTPFLPDHPIAWSPDGRWIAYLSGGPGSIPESSNRLEGRWTGTRRPAISRTRTADRSPGARTARICCSTRRSAPRKARSYASISSRARRASAKISSAISSSSRRARARRTSPRPGKCEPSATRRAQRADSARSAGRRNTEIVFDDIRRRATVLPIGVDAGAVAISPDGKTALISASAAGQQNLYTYSLDELSGQPAIARQLTSTPGFKQNAQFTADSKEVYYLENGRISAINVESRQAQDRQRHRGARRRLREGEGRRIPTGVDDSRRQLLRREDERRGLEGAWRRSTRRTSRASQNIEEMRRLMRLMIGELNASHTGFNGPSFSPQQNVGRLGLRFDRGAYESGGKLRVTEVIALSPAAIAGIVPGEFVQSVNGAAVDAPRQSRFAAALSDQPPRDAVGEQDG